MELRALSSLRALRAFKALRVLSAPESPESLQSPHNIAIINALNDIINDLSNNISSSTAAATDISNINIVINSVRIIIGTVGRTQLRHHQSRTHHRHRNQQHPACVRTGHRVFACSPRRPTRLPPMRVPLARSPAPLCIVTTPLPIRAQEVARQAL